MARLSLPLIFAILSVALVAACGGKSKRPSPLSHRIDDLYLAEMPVAEKQLVWQLQHEYAIAKLERLKAATAYRESATELTIAANERSHAAITVQSAESRKRAADRSGNMTRIEVMEFELRAARLALIAATQKFKYVAAYRAYLAKELRCAQDNVYAQQARFELIKARMAKQGQHRPRGFTLARFEAQAKRRARHAQRERAILNRQRDRVDHLRRLWRATQKQAQQIRNHDAQVKSAARLTDGFSL